MSSVARRSEVAAVLCLIMNIHGLRLSVYFLNLSLVPRSHIG